MMEWFDDHTEPWAFVLGLVVLFLVAVWIDQKMTTRVKAKYFQEGGT